MKTRISLRLNEMQTELMEALCKELGTNRSNTARLALMRLAREMEVSIG